MSGYLGQEHIGAEVSSRLLQARRMAALRFSLQTRPRLSKVRSGASPKKNASALSSFGESGGLV